MRVFLGRDTNGQRKFHNKTIHGTKKDAQKYLNAVLRKLDLGTFVEPGKRFLDAVAATRHATLFQFVVTTEMRPEEYLGLQWKDVDFKAGAAYCSARNGTTTIWYFVLTWERR